VVDRERNTIKFDVFNFSTFLKQFKKLKGTIRDCESSDLVLSFSELFPSILIFSKLLITRTRRMISKHFSEIIQIKPKYDAKFYGKFSRISLTTLKDSAAICLKIAALTRGLFHQRFCKTFCENMMRSFFGEWHLANIEQIWQRCSNLSLKFGVLFVGETYQ